MVRTSDGLVPSGCASYWTQFREMQRWESVRDAEERELMAMIHESVPMTRPVPLSHHEVHTIIEFKPETIAIPEKEAIRITNIVCLINTSNKRGLYLLKNGEWIFRPLDFLAAKVLEFLYRCSLYPANRRGVKGRDMRHLCGTTNTRSADAMLSKCVRDIRRLCDTEWIPPLIVDCEGGQWCFHKF